MHIAVIADTHIPARAHALPANCRARLEAAELVVHAGDHIDLASLQALRAIGPPVVAVSGNVDDRHVRAALPREARADVDGVGIAVVHDAGPARGRWERLRLRFPDARVVVFGHSHLPMIEDRDGLMILNPGSPTDRRRAPVHTMAVLETVPGGVLGAWIIDLDAPARPGAGNL